MYLSQGHCYYACPQQSYKDNATSSCLPCNTNCTFCFGPLNSNCTACLSTLYLDNTTCVTSCSAGLSPNVWNVCTWSFRTLVGLVLIIGALLVCT